VSVSPELDEELRILLAYFEGTCSEQRGGTAEFDFIIFKIVECTPNPTKLVRCPLGLGILLSTLKNRLDKSPKLRVEFLSFDAPGALLEELDTGMLRPVPFPLQVHSLRRCGRNEESRQRESVTGDTQVVPRVEVQRMFARVGNFMPDGKPVEYQPLRNAE